MFEQIKWGQAFDPTHLYAIFNSGLCHVNRNHLNWRRLVGVHGHSWSDTLPVVDTLGVGPYQVWQNWVPITNDELQMTNQRRGDPMWSPYGTWSPNRMWSPNQIEPRFALPQNEKSPSD
jgi:hypothetical protein